MVTWRPDKTDWRSRVYSLTEEGSQSSPPAQSQQRFFPPEMESDD